MLTAPSLGYSLLAPMLIVLAGAVVGVLVEAFVGKARRTAIQVTLSIGVLLLSLQQLWRIKDLLSTTAAVGSVTIDKAGIFLQATVILVIVLMGFYPKPVLDLINPTSEQVVTNAGFTDPVAKVGK